MFDFLKAHKRFFWLLGVSLVFGFFLCAAIAGFGVFPLYSEEPYQEYFIFGIIWGGVASHCGYLLFAWREWFLDI